jgi:two-component system, OmpR family, sensor histidine kinase TctE
VTVQRNSSLERRLLLCLGLLHVAVLTVFVMAYARNLFPDPQESSEHVLEELARALEAVLAEDGQAGARFEPSPALLDRLAGEGILFSIETPAGAILAASAEPPPVPAFGPDVKTAIWSAGGEDAPLNLRLDTVERKGGSYRIITALAALPADRAALVWEELREEVLPITLPLLGATLLIVLFTVRHMLLPMRELSRQVQAMGDSAAGVRLKTAGVPREILPLVHAVNDAFARIEDMLQRERRFTANAAHELRTPLAVLSQRVDALDTPEEQREALRRDVSRMARILDQLLAAARLGTEPAALQPVDLVPLSRELLADLAPLAAAAGKSIALHAPERPVLVRGDAASLSACLRNLVENGLRFTPPGTEVTVRIYEDAAIEVEDKGPGVPAADRMRIFEPFWRGSGSRGAGLGLAIVGDAIVRHGGRVSVTDAPGLQGALFRVELPPIQPAVARAEASAVG